MNRMRTRDVVLAALIAIGFVIHEIGTDWSALSESLHVIIAILGLLIVFGALGTFLYDRFAERRIDADEFETAVPQPALSRFLFHDTRSAPLWLAARLYLGIAWLTAGFEKITGSPSWLSSGSGLQKYWQNAASIPKTGKPAISYDWYRSMLQYMLDHQWYTWFSKLICLGELLVGIGLIVGGLTGIAAFFGALMNMSFMLAGSASTNPVLFTLSILIILAWRVAGLIGLDRWLLPALGAPWAPGRVVRGRNIAPSGSISG
jgi:thiosulfate dehydrogenase [quinone] large subunit